VAATGSEPRAHGSAGGGVSSAFSRRFSLRSRLALLYAAFFLCIVTAVLGGAYALVAHDIGNESRPLHLPNIQPISSQDRLVFDKAGVQVQFPLSGGLARLIGPHVSATQLAKARGGALAMARCMRAHGIAFDAPAVQAWLGGHGLRYSYTRIVNTGSRAYRTCFPLLDSSLPPQARMSADGSIPEYQRLGLIEEWAGGMFESQRSHSLHSLLVWLGVALGVMAVIAVLFGWLLAGRAVRPLRMMTSKARGITEESLHERLAAQTADDEIGELASTFDDMLTRLEQAFNAQKRFVANASHELRTPVTLERALLELALASPDTDAATLRRTCERVLASNKQQHQMIEALLMLARSQGGTDIQAAVDLAAIAQDAITIREQRLRAVTLDADLQPAPLAGDPALLESLIANLIDNAIIHNIEEDGWISIETGSEEDSIWLRISNSGPEVPASMTTEIFEPFRRIDGERTATATGLGLGLSIVQAVADLHQAAIETHPLQGGGLRVEVQFPRPQRVQPINSQPST
jgi:signal transduction histidine kinase